MKLYTEEQLTRYLLDEGIMELSDLANNLVPCIELPSDEEINELSWTYTLNKFGEVDDFIDARDGFEDGIKWMRDKITGGNK